jgi:hypothetical protein
VFDTATKKLPVDQPDVAKWAIEWFGHSEDDNRIDEAVRAFPYAEPTDEATDAGRLTTCNCRWDGEQQVQHCTLHEAHVDAIREWAERAKAAEALAARLATPPDNAAGREGQS